MGEMIFELVFWFVMAPIFGAVQAFVAIVWPSKDPEVHSLQQWIKWFCGIALVATFVAVVMFYRSAGFVTMTPAAVAYVCLIVAGMVGRQVEQRCREQQKTRTP